MTGQLGTPSSSVLGLSGATPSTMTLVMRSLAASVETAGYATVYDWPVESITVPCAVVGYPSRIEFDATYGDHHTWTVPVWFAAGKTGTDEARNVISEAIDDVRDLLNGASCETRVTGAEVTELSVSGVAYLAVRFDCEVFAP